MKTDPFGLSRVVSEPGVMPQRAKRLDPSLPIRDDELLIDVESLNVDAASFKQIQQMAHHDPKEIIHIIEEIVKTRGKLQNPVTGSGGMLLGRVREMGAAHPAKNVLKVGDRIATLVSLSLTPLKIDEVLALHSAIDRLDVRGHAILFSSGIYAPLPSDFSETMALAVLDVCGAPALIERYVRPNMRVAILGAGKSGALCLAQAKKQLQGTGQLLALDVSAQALEALRKIGLGDEHLTVDATASISVFENVERVTGGQMCDLVVNCASVPNTEMGAILSARAGGTVIFFSMATQFAAATLGAEGVGKDVTLIMGNGFVPGHADLTFDLLRHEPGLRALFEQRYV